MAGKFVNPAIPQVTQTVSAATPISTPSTPEGKLSLILDAYRQALSGRTVGIASQKASGKLLYDITRTFLSNVTDETFATMWKFYVENKDGVCREDRALVGIRQISDQKFARKALVLYNTFRAFTMKYRPAVSETEFTKSIPDHVLYARFTRAV